MSREATLNIFQQLAAEIPPLVPKEVREELQQSYAEASRNVHLTVEELDDIVVSFGRKLWAHREAFLEFYRHSESAVGEKFFEAKLSPQMRTAYRQYLDQGYTFADVYVGKDIGVFSEQQRQQLCELLVAVTHELWDYTVQRVLGVDRALYEKRIEAFRVVQQRMDREIEELRRMADEEQEHPELAAEMREHIRGFEHSMALLGPKLDTNAVCDSVEHFSGRKEERSHQKLCRPIPH